MTRGVLPPDWTLREASLRDLEAIMALEVRGFPPGVVEQPEVFRRRLEVFSQGFLVLEHRSHTQASGYLTAELWSPRTDWENYPFALNHDLAAVHNPQGSVLYIASMTLDPLVRGTGLGKTFFQESLGYLLESFPKVQEVILIVGEHWRGAQKIYRHCGFLDLGRIPHFLTPRNSPPEDVLVMICPRGELHW